MKTKTITRKDGSPAQRTCLRCGKRFSSAGVGNRLCDPCKIKD